MTVRFSPHDHQLVTAAVTQAERATDGEIVTIVADRSDRYHDVALHWAVLVMLLPLALFAVRPDWLTGGLTRLLGGWGSEPSLHQIVTALLVLTALAFLLALLALRAPALRMAVTPPATKARRVRRRAIDLFKAGTDRRTVGRTGVLLYVSLAEHRAEIVADEAIHGRVSPEVWGEAMAELVTRLRAGQPGEGMAAAVARVGAVLAEHFPRTSGDTNELPDRLIQL